MTRPPLTRAADQQRDRWRAVVGASVPLIRAVRPNSVTTATTVRFQAAPMPVSIAANAPSSAPSRAASRPSTAPSSAWVSQPSKASAPTRGPSGGAMNLAALPAEFGEIGAHRGAGPCAPGASAFAAACPCRRRARWPRGRCVPQARGPAPHRCGDKDRAAASGCRRSRAASAAASRTAPAPGRAPPAASPGRPRRRCLADRRGRPVRVAASARLSQPVSAAPGLGQAALQHILAVEMRALAIGRGDRVHDAGLAAL